MNKTLPNLTIFDTKPSETGLHVRLYTDGGSRGNDKGEGCGKGAGAWIVVSEAGDVITKGTQYYGIVTNNEAEYLSLIHGFESLINMHPVKVECFSDSTLLVNQMNGTFKIKKDTLKKLAIEAKKFEAQLGIVSYHQVPRTNPMIRTVDRMLNKTMDENSV